MLKKSVLFIVIAAACTLPSIDLLARGGGGHGGGRGGGGHSFHGGGGRGFHGGGRGWHGGGWGGRGWGGRGYWGGRGWGWGGRRWGWGGGWGLGLGFGWGWPYGGWRGGYWGWPYWGWRGGWGWPYWGSSWAYPWWGYRAYAAYPWWAYTNPAYQTPATYQQPQQQVPQEPDYARDSAGQTFWTINNQAPFPIKIATDREVIVVNPGEQKTAYRSFDFTFTAEGGGTSRQFVSRDHQINLDVSSFGMQFHAPAQEAPSIDPAYLSVTPQQTYTRPIEQTYPNQMTAPQPIKASPEQQNTEKPKVAVEKGG